MSDKRKNRKLAEYTQHDPLPAISEAASSGAVDTIPAQYTAALSDQLAVLPVEVNVDDLLRAAVVVVEPQLLVNAPAVSESRYCRSDELAREHLIVVETHPDCSVREFRDYTNTGTDAKSFLLELEAKGLVSKRWLNKAYRFSITAAGSVFLNG